MSKDVRAKWALLCDVETAFTTMTSADWQATKAERLGDGNRLEERTERADGGIVVRSTRGLPSSIPGFLEKLIPAGGRAGQEDTWGPALPDGSRAGTWKADVPGAPVDVRGTMRLVPTHAGCDYVVEGTVKVKIPLIGGKAEGFVVQATEGAVEAEAKLLREVLPDVTA